ncbi:unnamed protein product [Chironomus riparius]|uniref:Putative ionotropic receptor ligand binding domain-containing protein n=1 Tax=Chironomus riparius TaxID=315576 RepID=A0A9N9RXX8_9DIPT|nr:unnamed protein product [Chironomus riparius]
MKFILVTVLLLFQNISCEHDEILVQATTEMAAHVCESAQLNANLIIIKRNIEKNHIFDFLDDLLKRLLDVCVVRVKDIDSFSQPDPLKHSIFLIHSMDNFWEYRKLFTSKVFDFRKFFLFVMLNGKEYNFEMMMQSMWKINIYNVNIIYAENKNEASVLTFFPFQRNNCANTHPVIINKFQNGRFISNEGKFYPDKFKNLNNCSIRVGTSLDASPCVEEKVSENGQKYPSGSDISVLNGLSEALNFHIDYTFTKSQGYLDKDGNADGPFKLLLEKNVDLGFDCYWLTRTRLEHLDSTAAYYNDYAIIVVSPGKEFSAFEKLEYPFSWTVWILLLTTSIAGLIIICIVKFSRSKRLQNFIFGSNVNAPDLNMLAALLGGAQSILPKGNFARFLLFNYLMFALNIRTFYQALMFHLMQAEHRHPELQSIDEIKANDLSIFVLKTSAELFMHNENIKSRIVNITSQQREEYMNQLIDNPSFKGTLILGKYKVMHRNYLNRGMEQITICKEHLMSLAVVFYTPKNFYLNEKLDEKISLFMSAGLIKYWHIYETKVWNEQGEAAKVLTLHHLFGSFQILMLGVVVSSIVFIIEYLWNFLKR